MRNLTGKRLTARTQAEERRAYENGESAYLVIECLNGMCLLAVHDRMNGYAINDNIIRAGGVAQRIKALNTSRHVAMKKLSKHLEHFTDNKKDWYDLYRAPIVIEEDYQRRMNDQIKWAIVDWRVMVNIEAEGRLSKNVYMQTRTATTINLFLTCWSRRNQL